MASPVTYKLFVPGIARTSGSHKSFKGRIIHSGTHTKAWMDTISWHFMQEFGRPVLTDDPVQLTLSFSLCRKKDHYGTGKNKDKRKPSAPFFHTKTPDLDKLCRAVQDALTKLAWQDDSQVIHLWAKKHWVDKWETPGVMITVEPIVDGESG